MKFRTPPLDGEISSHQGAGSAGQENSELAAVADMVTYDEIINPTGAVDSGGDNIKAMKLTTNLCYQKAEQITANPAYGIA